MYIHIYINKNKRIKPCTLERTPQHHLIAMVKHGKQQSMDGEIPKVFLYGELVTGKST